MSFGAVLTTAAVGGKAFWYLTRASGLVTLVLLTATIVLGVVASIGWTTERWPRFLSQDIHRNVSLLCLVFLGVHVTTTILDGYVPIGLIDVFLPFHSPYRPIYVGLGALGFDLLLAVLVTSALRHRIGYSSWRFVHWLAYLCWPIALVHGLGSGTDTRLTVVLGLEAVCTLAVLGTFAWRLGSGRDLPIRPRVLAGTGAVVATLAIVSFAALGPLRPGWSHRSGTSPAVLAQLAAKSGSAATSGTASGNNPSGASTPTPTPTPTPTGVGGTAALPSVPFTSAVTGTQTQTAPDARGVIQVRLAMHLTEEGSTPLTIVLVGTQSGPGVSLASGTVTLGTFTGPVTGLNGGTVVATVAAPRPTTLTITLQVDQQSGRLSGSVSATAGTER